MPSSSHPAFRIGDIRIHVLTFDQALDEIEGIVDRGEGGYIVTPNVDHVVLAQSDHEFRKSYQNASLILADGMPIVWASKIIGPKLPQKISGSDLIVPLMERAAKRGYRVYLLGASKAIAERATAKLREQISNLMIVGIDSPYVQMGDPIEKHHSIINRIKETGPHLVLMALGTPKQEIFMYRYANELRPTVAIGIGAGLDFLAGAMPRAPTWISEAGLEWLYRLSHEPRRLWKRYLVRDPKFLLIFLNELYKTRIQRP